MFQVDDYEISFTYRNINRPTGNCKVESRQATLCKIRYENGPTIICGYAYLHPNEQLDKNRGRKIALARALKQRDIKRPQRIRIWNTYFDTVSPKNDPRPGPSAREIKVLRQCLKLPEEYHGELPIAASKNTAT